MTESQLHILSNLFSGREALSGFDRWKHGGLTRTLRMMEQRGWLKEGAITAEGRKALAVAGNPE